MGRMADARKRAKRGAVSPAEEPKPEQAEREPPASEPAFADDAVFADDPEPGSVLHGEQQQLRADRDSLPGSERGGAGGAAQHPPQQVSLPASGLAEDILKSFEQTPAEPSVEEVSAAPVALPASGLAEEVLGREQTLSFDAGEAVVDDAAVLRPIELTRRTPRATPLPSRLTEEEQAAHAAFIEKLGPNALWLKAG